METVENPGLLPVGNVENPIHKPVSLRFALAALPVMFPQGDVTFGQRSGHKASTGLDTLSKCARLHAFSESVDPENLPGVRGPPRFRFACCPLQNRSTRITFLNVLKWPT